MRIRDESANYAKKATNLSINEGLLLQARELDINLSAMLERALDAEIRERRRAQWLEENREAIAAYNDHVQTHGVFSPMFRTR